MNMQEAPRGRRKFVQDVSAARDPDALLTIETVAALIGFAPVTIREWVRHRRFPPGQHRGRNVRWPAHVVRAWMANPAAWKGVGELPITQPA